VKKAFSAEGATSVIKRPAQFEKILRADVERWSATIRAAGIKAE